MAIVDVKMVTGWIPVTSTLDELVKDESLGIQKYEEDGNIVHIYFDKFDSAGQCFYFDLEQDIEVSDPKKAFIKVYDYYETDLQAVLQYGLKTTCGTKEELPEISVDQYLRGIFFTSVDEIQQVRVPIGLERDGTRGPVVPDLTCPICDIALPMNKADFKELVCQSEKVFKAVAGRPGMYSMKIYADIRTKRKTKINKFANFRLGPNCVCDSMPVSESKVLILAHTEAYDMDNKQLTLDDGVTVLPWSKPMEKSLRRLVTRKRRGCN